MPYIFCTVTLNARRHKFTMQIIWQSWREIYAENKIIETKWKLIIINAALLFMSGKFSGFCPRSCSSAASKSEIVWSLGIFENKETSQFQIRFIIIPFITLSSVMCQFLLVPSEVLIYFVPHCCFRKENDVLLYNRLSKHVKRCQTFLKSFPWLL
jgi:hypothetical protein